MLYGFPLKLQLLTQHGQLLTQAGDTGLHVGDAGGRGIEGALHQLDLLPNTGDSRLTLGHGLPGSIPVGFGKGQRIIAIVDLNLGLGHGSLCVVQCGLGLNDRVGRLIDLSRITGSLGRGQLLLGGLQGSLALGNRLSLQHPLLFQHVELCRQSRHGRLHVGNAHRRLPELTLREADVVSYGGNRRLRRAHSLACGIPAVGGKGQLIVYRLQLRFRVLHCSVGIVQRGLRVSHSLCCLIDPLRIVSRLSRRQLGLCLGEDVGILCNRLVLQVQLLGEHVGACRQPRYSRIGILHTRRSDIELTLRQPELIADASDGCFGASNALRSVKPPTASEGQLGVAGIDGLFRFPYSSLRPGERRLRVGHGVRGLPDQVSFVDTLCCGLLFPRRPEDVLILLDSAVLKLEPFLKENHFRRQPVRAGVHILDVHSQQAEGRVGRLHLLSDADEGVFGCLDGFSGRAPVGLGQSQRLIGFVNLCFGLLDGSGSLIEVAVTCGYSIGGILRRPLQSIALTGQLPHLLPSRPFLLSTTPGFSKLVALI